MRYAFLLVIAITHPAYAEDPFSCVNPDVADAFLGNSHQGRGEYSTSIPARFAAVSVPTGLSLVGSLTDDLMTTVVYKGPMKTDAAIDAVVVEMAKAGWTEDEQQHWPGNGGFQTRPRSMATVLCHDDEKDALSVIAAERSGKTFVSYVQHSSSQSCGAASPAAVRHNPSEMMRLLPTMKLPEGAKASNSGMGGNGHEVGSHVDISGTVGRSDLLNYFENQIRDQEWKFQTGWSSDNSSGSVWVLDTVDDGTLIGTLHLFDSGGDPIRVRFSVNPADPSKGKSNGSWSGSSH